MKTEQENYVKELNGLISNKNDECDYLKQKLKDLVNENELYATECKDSRYYIESLQNEIKGLDREKNELLNREESEIEQMKVMKDDITSLTTQTQQLKSENSKLHDVKKQKEDYIQILLTEKQLLHEEIRDLTSKLKNNTNINHDNILTDKDQNKNSDL